MSSGWLVTVTVIHSHHVIKYLFRHVTMSNSWIGLHRTNRFAVDIVVDEMMVVLIVLCSRPPLHLLNCISVCVEIV